MILTGVSGSNSSGMALDHVYSCWGVACLSKVVAALYQPAPGQVHWDDCLACLVAAFYMCALQ